MSIREGAYEWEEDNKRNANIFDQYQQREDNKDNLEDEEEDNYID